MPLVLQIFLLFFGFILLIKGADFLVDGASSLALKAKISPLVIGLTIVSFGTSAPELVVNVIAAMNRNAALSFGNIIGSNIANILLILGVSALIRPLVAQRNTVWKEIPFSLMAVFALIFLCNDSFFASGENMLARNDGLILLLFFAIFIVYTFSIPKIDIKNLPDIKHFSSIKIAIVMLLGAAGLFFGGKLVVDNAVTLAKILGLSDRIIGLTVVAQGTSLPELATSAVAAYRDNADIAIGNVIGSNIFNIFLILGITSLIQPLPFHQQMNIDMAVLAVASFALFFILFIGPTHRLGRRGAIIFLLIYVIFTAYILGA